MHELGIMQNIVSAVEEYTLKNAISKVAKVLVEVGDISGVVPEALEFCFGICAQNTVLEGAMLVLERVPAIGRCKACGEEFNLLTNDFTCSSCLGNQWEVISGKELIIKGLEVA